jgi:hypothetical protein
MARPHSPRGVRMHNHRMRSRTALMGHVVISLLTAAVAGCGIDGRAAESPAEGQVEVLEIAVETDQYEILDLGRPGASVGDMDVYSGKAVNGGSRVAHGGGSCQVMHIDGDKITTQCLITMELERGSLTLQSLWVKGTSPLDMAISGGTGVYRNARGTVRFWDIATPNERLHAEIVY